MPGEQVRDLRGLYLHGVGQADSVTAPLPWNHQTTVGQPAGHVQVSGPGVLGGVLISARGAAAVNVDVYDAGNAADVKDDNIAFPVETGTFDGGLDTPITMGRGIRVVIAGAGANTRVTIFYR